MAGPTTLRGQIHAIELQRLKAGKLRKVRWYDLRHSFDTHLVGAGVDAKTVAQLMGHRNVTLTLTHYTHPDVAAHRAAVARLPWQNKAVENS